MEYLVKRSPTNKQVDYAHVAGEHDREIRPTKAHIWIESKNNTMCNMYGGNPDVFNEDRWFISDEDHPMICRVCLRNKEKKGVDGVNDNNNCRNPNKI